MIEHIEEVLTWPVAMRECVVQLLSKIEVAGRPISLTQAVYRVWSRLRKPHVAGWTRARAAHRDRAVAGSSALRAALLRQTTMEVHSALGFSVTQTLVDLEKFYDHIPPSTVVETAYQVEYPLLSLALGLQMHQAPRRIATEPGIPQNMWPTRSLMAGCGQSVDYGRLTLWDVLEFAHAQYKPRELGTWADDIIHQEVGKEEDVVDKAEAVVQGLVG